ncbi:MAG: ABC transporter substrate-binding protein [Lachnospiraceae bacterium]|nr:ABC transporter substrate-binding protein [Lachnospiraceae bacterium]
MKKIFNKITVLGLIAALTIGALAACGSAKKEDKNESAKSTEQTKTVAVSENASEAKADGELPVIRFNTCFATGMTGAVNNFAIEKGLYKELGIEFDNVQNADGSQGKLSLITRGEIDLADGDPSSYIPGINNGVPGKLVGNMWRYSGCYWLIANNDIKSFEDLRGKKIGTSGASGGMKLSVLKMLEANGIKEDEVELIANGSYQKAYATLTSGEVDATIIHNPYAELAKVEGVGNVLGRAWDFIPDYYTGTIIASNDLIENRPEDLQRFVTAYYKVHEQVKNEYFDEFIEWGSEYLNTDKDVLREAVLSEIDVWLDYPVIPEDRLEKTFEYLKEYGWVENDVTLEGTYTNEFALKAAEELGLKDPESK